MFIAYLDIGNLEYLYRFYGAKMWLDERVKRFKCRYSPSLYLYCSMGKIKLEEL